MGPRILPDPGPAERTDRLLPTGAIVNSSAPTSTTGAAPIPVSGTSIVSMNRGSPSMSVVVPAETALLFPASTRNRDALVRWTFAGSPPLKKPGSARMFPAPAYALCTSLYVIGTALLEPQRMPPGLFQMMLLAAERVEFALQ